MISFFDFPSDLLSDFISDFSLFFLSSYFSGSSLNGHITNAFIDLPKLRIDENYPLESNGRKVRNK